MYVKLTQGCVVQQFTDEGECVQQQFVAGDTVEFLTEEGKALTSRDMPLGGHEYRAFDMVQPGSRWPQPTPSQESDGWRIEPGFLERVRDKVVELNDDYGHFLEDIEDMLRATELVLDKRE